MLNSAPKRALVLVLLTGVGASLVGGIGLLSFLLAVELQLGTIVMDKLIKLSNLYIDCFSAATTFATKYCTEKYRKKTNSLQQTFKQTYLR